MVELVLLLIVCVLVADLAGFKPWWAKAGFVMCGVALWFSKMI